MPLDFIFKSKIDAGKQNVNDWFPPRGGYQPVANLTPQNSAAPLPPIPHGGSGESGRNGNKVSGKNGS